MRNTGSFVFRLALEKDTPGGTQLCSAAISYAPAFAPLAAFIARVLTTQVRLPFIQPDADEPPKTLDQVCSRARTGPCTVHATGIAGPCTLEGGLLPIVPDASRERAQKLTVPLTFRDQVGVSGSVSGRLSGHIDLDGGVYINLGETGLEQIAEGRLSTAGAGGGGGGDASDFAKRRLSVAAKPADDDDWENGSSGDDLEVEVEMPAPAA